MSSTRCPPKNSPTQWKTGGRLPQHGALAKEVKMKRFFLICAVITAVLLFPNAISAGNSARLLANPGELKWEKAANGSESATLRENPEGVELLAHYPAGHVFPPHWHSANERVVLIEGRISMAEEGKKVFLEPGGYAYMPAKQVQRMKCVSDTRCSFYVFWDGALDFHLATD
jgi:quercetin dioxygenase-like cupin family protein